MSMFTQFFFDSTTASGNRFFINDLNDGHAYPSSDRGGDADREIAMLNIEGDENLHGGQNHHSRNSSLSSYGDHLEGLVAGMLSVQQVGETVNDHLQENGDAFNSVGGQTILSSAASDDFVLQNRRLSSSNVLHVTAANHPSADPLSISTTSSCYISLKSEDADNDSLAERSVASLSYRPSFFDSSISLITQTESAPQTQVSGNADDSCGNVTQSNPGNGGSLLPCSQASPQPSSTSTALTLRSHNASRTQNDANWFSSFTHSDWESFYKRAKQAVQILQLVESPQPMPRPVLRLPPSVQDRLLEVIQNEQNGPPFKKKGQATDASHVFPSCFICPLCRDVIVGALILDCGCGITVCSQCFEFHKAATDNGHNDTTDTFHLARELDYNIVPLHDGQSNVLVAQPCTCPSCGRFVNNPLPCHALNVAIFQNVLRMKESSNESCQHSYLLRLAHWRDEVIRRNQEIDQAVAAHNDEQIAQLIAAEEECLWLRSQASSSACQRIRSMMISTGPIGFVAAVVASIGIKLLTTRQ